MGEPGSHKYLSSIMPNTSIDDLVDEAQGILRGTSRSMEASFFLLGLLALQLEEKRCDNTWPEKANWESIQRAKSVEAIREAVEVVQERPETAELGNDLVSLGLKNEEAVRRGVRYGRDSMLDRSDESLLSPLINFTCKLRNLELQGEKVSEFVDRLLDSVAEHAGKRGASGAHYTPKKLAELIAEILDPEAGSSIYDPATGTGGLLLSVRDHPTEEGKGRVRLFGQEIHPQIAALSRINCRLHGAANKIVNGDTLRAPGFISESSIQTFDYVVANPPLRLKIGSEVQEQLRNDEYGRFDPESINRRADSAFIQHVAESLNDCGRAVVVVSPTVFQASGREQRLIRRLLKRDLVEAAVTLPGGFLGYTAAPIGLLILSRNKPSNIKNSMMLVEVGSFEGNGKRLSYGQRRRIIASANQYSEIANFSVKVPVEELIQNDAVISPARYVTAENLSSLLGGLGERKKLDKIATVVRGNHLSDHDSGDLPFIQAGDISGERIVAEGLSASARGADLRQELDNLARCQEGDILMKTTAPFDTAAAGKSVTGVPVNRNVVILRLSEEHRHLQQFLLEFFQSDTAHRLLSSLAGGASLRSIRISELRQLHIPIPNDAFLSLIRDLRDVEERLETKQSSLGELRQQLFDLRDTNSSEAHVRDLSTRIQVLSDGLIRSDDWFYQLRNFYPFPVAYGYRSLSSTREPAQLYEGLLNVAENLFAFLGSVGISVVLNTVDLPERDGALNKRRLQETWERGISFGNWRDIAFLSAKELRKQGTSGFSSDYASIWFQGSAGSKTSEFFNVANKIVEKRNDSRHGRGPNSKVEFQEHVADLEEMVNHAYKSIDFLIRYPLHLVERISKPFREDGFDVESLEYMGDHPGMQHKEKRLPESVSEGLLYIEVSQQRWIPLYPMVSVHHCPKCKRRETYMIDKWDGTYECRMKSFERGHVIESTNGMSNIASDLRKVLG